MFYIWWTTGLLTHTDVLKLLTYVSAMLAGMHSSSYVNISHDDDDDDE